MPFSPSWQQIALRLVLSFLAGALIGMEREEQGRAAGLRTTILVCLAASVAMIQANLLLVTIGKSGASFSIMDVMRLPLGILTGMGFIGAGTVLRRGEMIRGVTTAAALWFVTVIGLCIGGGQIVLGLVGVGFALLTLWGLRWLELRVTHDHHVHVSIVVEEKGISEEDIRDLLVSHGFRVISYSVSTIKVPARQEISYELSWRGKLSDTKLPLLYETLVSYPSLSKVEWRQ